MGRIAEALKKAQRERDEQVRLGLGEPGVGRTPGGATAAEPCAAATAEAPDRVSRAGDGVARQRVAAIRGLGPTFPSRRSVQPLGPLPQWDVHPAVVAVGDRSSSIAEQYRAIRTWLLRRNVTGERTSLAITSSIQREGKSVTTANLAVFMAEIRHMNVLAVDGDLREGSLAGLFKIPSVPGLADVLAGRTTLSDAIVKTPLGNFWILPAGACQGLNPTELLSSSAATRVFDEIRERYHYTLVDTPPVQRLSDVGVIGALCTGILVVVRMHKTPSNLVQQSIHWLHANNLNVVGCVATRSTLRDSRHVYRGPRDDE